MHFEECTKQLVEAICDNRTVDVLGKFKFLRIHASTDYFTLSETLDANEITNYE